MTRFTGIFDDHPIIPTFSGYQHVAITRLVLTSFPWVRDFETKAVVLSYFSACIATTWTFAFKKWIQEIQDSDKAEWKVEKSYEKVSTFEL